MLNFLIASLLSVGALAAKKTNDSKFANFHSQAVAAGGPLEIDDNAFDQITASSRDYSAAILLTAREAKFGCQLCRDFDPEWKIIAQSWQKSDKKGEQKMLFATLDFAQGRNSFAKVWNATVWECTLINVATTSKRTRPPALSAHSWSKREG